MGQFSPSVSFLDSPRRSRGDVTCPERSIWKHKRHKRKRLSLPIRKALGGKLFLFFFFSINFMVSIYFLVLKQRQGVSVGQGECVVRKEELRKLTIMHTLDNVFRHYILHFQNTF